MILQTVASINPAIGGPAVSVSRLATELQALDLSVRIASLDYTEHGSLPILSGALLEVEACNPLTRPLRGWSPALWRRILGLSNAAQIIHNHGIWMFPNHYAALAARQSGKPLITSPRGMLGSWALSYHSWPKKLLWNLREKSDLSGATAFHATSRQEADDIRRAGFTQPIAIIPNGVDLPTATIPDQTFLENSIPWLKGKRLALFLSRIHPKKGLRELVEAWSRLPDQLREEWVLLLVGPDLTGYQVSVESHIHEKNMESFIHLHPAVKGSFKQALLERAQLFVLPSHEENFGIAVAEALAHGTPVITTQRTPWESLPDRKCGWWIPLSVDSLAETLIAALSLPPQTLSDMGESGRSFAQTDLSWKAIAQKMALFYEWILKKGKAPAFVRIN